jgi:hypothetical protein
LKPGAFQLWVRGSQQLVQPPTGVKYAANVLECASGL